MLSGQNNGKTIAYLCASTTRQDLNNQKLEILEFAKWASYQPGARYDMNSQQAFYAWSDAQQHFRRTLLALAAFLVTPA
jgi:hypothetical protein